MATGRDTVLVVEDEEEARTFLVQILEYEGYSVLGFANGAEALDYLAQSEQPCLIVMDLRMPNMDGPRFRSALLKDPRLAKVPIVVVTALDPSSAAGLGALRVLRKPVDVDVLLSIIRQHC
jgi:CheY-like chemotaxis protein